MENHGEENGMNWTQVAPECIFEFRLKISVGAPIEHGTWDAYRRRTIPILGGTFEGNRLRGEIVPGGADFQCIRVADGVAQLDARYTLRATDGTVIGIHNTGIRRGPPDVMARLAAGEIVSPDSYYFRTVAQFQVEPGPYQWLTEHIYIGVGRRWPDAVEVDIYRTT
jgi:Protein of unknown function (DUF3237)